MWPNSQQKQLREWFALTHSLGVQSIVAGKAWSRSTGQLVMVHPQEGETDECWHPACFFSFYSAHGMVIPIFRVGIYASVNPIQKLPYMSKALSSRFQIVSSWQSMSTILDSWPEGPTCWRLGSQCGIWGRWKNLYGMGFGKRSWVTGSMPLKGAVEILALSFFCLLFLTHKAGGFASLHTHVMCGLSQVPSMSPMGMD